MTATTLQWKKTTPDRWRLRTKAGAPYLTIPSFDGYEQVMHGFTTRLGGVSEGNCTSMNLSFTRGDEKSAVQQNYQIIADAMGFSLDSVVCSDQTHTANVRIVDEKDCGSGLLRPKDYHDVDGLITNCKGVTLATFYADCVPLYLFDPVKQVIGLCHSGWKGTVGRIGAAAVAAMTATYGSDPKDIVTAIGPSICVDCYEVSEDVAVQFQTAFGEDADRKMLTNKGKGKYQLDLWQACTQVFLDAGIGADHIFGPDLCTCCNPKVLFSHRASGGKRGNLAAFLALK